MQQNISLKDRNFDIFLTLYVEFLAPSPYFDMLNQAF